MGIDLTEALEGRRSAPRRRLQDVSIGYEDGSGDLIQALRLLPKELRQQIAAVIKASAKTVADEAKEMLAGTRARGRRRKIGPLTLVLIRGRNEPSAPGRPPVQQTGELRRSLRVVRQRRDGLAYRIEAEFYARFLEGGAEGSGKRRLQPRPFLSVALENNRALIEAQIAEAVQRAIDAVKA